MANVFIPIKPMGEVCDIYLREGDWYLASFTREAGKQYNIIDEEDNG